MHRALILSSYYSPESGYPNPADWQRTHLLRQRFVDMGYLVETLASGPGLVEALRQRLRFPQPQESLLIYFVGYLLVTDDGEPALLVADSTAAPLRLSQLAARAGGSFGRVLFVLDTVLGSRADQIPYGETQPPEATVCGATLNGIEPDNVGALVSVRPWGCNPEVSFSDALNQTLSGFIQAGAAVDSIELMRALQGQPIEAHQIGLSETDPNFLVVPQQKFPSNPAVPVATRVPSAGGESGSESALDNSEVRRKLPSDAAETSGLPASQPEATHEQHAPPEATHEQHAAPEPVAATDAVATLAGPSEADAERPVSAAAAESDMDAPGEHVSLQVSQPPIGPLEAVETPDSWQAPPLMVEPEDEAALLKQARAANEAGDGELALSTSRYCLRLFPRSLAALQLTSSLLAQLERWDQLAAVYEQLLLTPLDVEPQVKLRVALSRVYASKLNAPETALDMIERASELQPKNAALHLEAAALCEVNMQLSAAEQHYRATLKLEPLEARSYRRAAAFFNWSNDLDAAWNTAAVLNYLGGANEQEAALVESRRVQTVPQLGRPLVESDFQLGLSASAADPALSQLLCFLAAPVASLKAATAKQGQSLIQGCTRETVEGSTATLARTLSWAATLLGVEVPILYLTDEPGAFRPLPLQEPAWLVSKTFGRGKSPQELVFYWARSLSQLRPECRVLLYVQGRAELLTLLESCYDATGKQSAEFDDAKRLSRALAKTLVKAETETLKLKLDSIPFEKLPSRLDNWLSEVNHTANRLGLVACGDPELAARALEDFPGSEAKGRDSELEALFGFAVSDSYARLRQLLGVSLNRAAAAE